MAFDWHRAIELNRIALEGVVSHILLILLQHQSDRIICMAVWRRRLLLRLLVPAEAAARRLIFIVARVMKLSGLLRQAAAKRPPDFKAFAPGSKAPRFMLVDPRKNLDWSAFASEKGASSAAAVGTPSDKYAPIACDDILCRTQALEAALKDLPASARRMAQEEAKRLLKKPGPSSVPPFRMGFPPGHHKKRSYEVDDVLAECAALARDLENAPP